MNDHSWVDEFPAAITVSDAAGIIVAMNDRAAKAYAKHGGRKLIGTNMFDCHPEPARSKLKQLIDSRRTNVYTIERNGARTLIYQAPWYKSGQYAGFVELDFDIPAQMPHFVRK
ncbi:MAG: diguanylate cyclase [Planctomycetota bacterium]|nr:diguanylate cyclase [Planctomycetota bacterium]